MIEARWLSPDDQRIRWMAGVSQYNNNVVNLVWSQYDAILNGYADQLAIPPSPNVIFSEDSTNIGLFWQRQLRLDDRHNPVYRGPLPDRRPDQYQRSDR